MRLHYTFVIPLLAAVGVLAGCAGPQKTVSRNTTSSADARSGITTSAPASNVKMRWCIVERARQRPNVATGGGEGRDAGDRARPGVRRIAHRDLRANGTVAGHRHRRHYRQPGPYQHNNHVVDRNQATLHRTSR